MRYPTEQLQRLAEVMDRLRSPGGCPWDAEQTHESLLKYLLEEAYEYIEAVESGDAEADRKSTRLNSSHMSESRMPSSA